MRMVPPCSAYLDGEAAVNFACVGSRYLRSIVYPKLQGQKTQARDSTFSRLLKLALYMENLRSDIQICRLDCQRL
jgi:hypothetical protein